MTYREFIKSALPPAPEDPALRRLRFTTAALCLVSAILLGLVRGMNDVMPWLSVFAVVLSLFSFALLVRLFVRKVRHDLDYWTPERVEQHCPSPRPTTRIDPVIDVLADRH